MLKETRVVVLAILFFSCQQSAKHAKSSVMRMADLECRAISLREQRFALANEIRFAQDTLLHFSTTKDTATLSDSLQIFLQKKEILLQASLQLADTIHKQLDSLRKFSFKNVDDKHAFDKKLSEELKRRGCSKQKLNF